MKVIEIAVQALSLVLFCICAYKIIKVAFRYAFIQYGRPIAPIKMTKPEYLKILITVTCLYVAAFVIAIIIAARDRGGISFTPISIYSTLRDVFTKGDALHYMHIAKYGYVTEGLAKNWLAFYPTFPLLVRLVREVVRSYYLASIIVNFSFTYISAIFLYMLIVGETGSRRFAYRAVLLMVCVPQSLFFVAPYGEAVFFAFTLISIYAIRRGKFLIGAIFGFLSATTRNVGIIVAAIFVLEYLSQRYHTIKEEGSWIPHIAKSVAMTMLILGGQVAYLLLNKAVTGSYNTYATYQIEYWGQAVGNFVSTIGYLVGNIPNPGDMSWLMSLPSIAAFGFFLYWLYKKAPRMRPSLGVYALCYFYVIFAPTTLLSGLRYTMVCFPLYLLLCDLEIKKYYILLTVFVCGWLYFMVAFARGFNVF